MHDDKEIAIQIVKDDEPDDLKHLIMTKFWNTQTWDLDMPRELWVKKSATVDELAQEISKSYGVAKDDLLVTKINSSWSFHRVILPFSEWVSMEAAEHSTSYIYSAPFYLSTDGILFIVRKKSEDVREMTAHEKELYRCDEFES